MKKAVLFVVMAFILNPAGIGWAVVFDVDTEAKLRNALGTAARNGLDDTINIAAGQYNTSGSTFLYAPAATENYSLTIVGAGVGNTVLDGGGLRSGDVH
jgi:hypothetical protein